MEKEETLEWRQELRDQVLEKISGLRKEEFRRLVEEKIGNLLELSEIDFFRVGDRYGLEQLLPDPSAWGGVSEITRQAILEEVGSFLGADLVNTPEDLVIRRYKEEGVPGQPSEGGAEVTVLKTNKPPLTVHVVRHANPDLGTRYDLVREV